MKIKLIWLGLFFWLNCAMVHGADLTDGFMGTRWGTTAENLSQFSKVRSNDDVSYYVNPSQVFEFNNHIIHKVIYGFYQKQFFAVYIKIEELELFGEVRDYMTTKYGEPSMKISMKSGLKTYQWKYQQIKMKLKVNEKDGNMKLSFYYTPFSKKINEAQQEIFVDQSAKWFPIDKQNPPQTLPSIPLLRF